MFVFRTTTEDRTRVARRILRTLDGRQAMHIGELCLRLGLAEPLVREELESLRQRDQVECLRPWSYDRDDLDFFRIPTKRWNQFAPQAIRMVGDAMACV